MVIWRRTWVEPFIWPLLEQQYGPDANSDSNRDEYQEYFLGGGGGGKGDRCVGLTTLPHSCAYYLKIWEPQPPGTLRAVQVSNGIALPLPCFNNNKPYI
jgi:hypothetical protein